MAVSDSLILAALAFRRAELWRAYPEDCIFAVRLENGVTGYCPFMAPDKKQECECELSVFPGQSAFSGLHRMQTEEDFSRRSAMMHDLTAERLTCRFTDAEELTPYEKRRIRALTSECGIPEPQDGEWPVFFLKKPFKCAVTLKESDEEPLLRALLAGENLARKMRRGEKNFEKVKEILLTPPDGDRFRVPLLAKNGTDRFRLESAWTPEPLPFDYPEPKIRNRRLAEELRAAPKKGRTEAGILPLFFGEGDVPGNFQPFMAVLARTDDSMFLPTLCDRGWNLKQAELTLQTIAETLLKAGAVPEEITVSDRMTAALFDNFCRTAGICFIRQNKPSEALSAALDATEQEVSEALDSLLSEN